MPNILAGPFKVIDKRAGVKVKLATLSKGEMFLFPTFDDNTYHLYGFQSIDADNRMCSVFNLNSFNESKIHGSHRVIPVTCEISIVS